MNPRASAPPPPVEAGTGARAGGAPAGYGDEAWLDRLAARIVTLRLETPALIALETVRPVRGLAAHGVVFLQPFAEAMLGVGSAARLTRLLERPESLEGLAARIEALTGARR